MTTIAYRDGVLAVDSRATRANEIVPYPVDKLFRMPDGSLVAGAGQVDGLLAAVEWIANRCKGEPPDFKNTTIVHLMHDRLLEYVNAPLPVPIPLDAFDSWGSGSSFAIAGMHCGLTAEAAVELACKCDGMSAPPVVSDRVTAPARKPRRTGPGRRK